MVVDPPLRNMDGDFTKLVDGALRAVAKILTAFVKRCALDVLLGSDFASLCFLFLSDTRSIGSIF